MGLRIILSWSTQIYIFVLHQRVYLSLIIITLLIIIPLQDLIISCFLPKIKIFNWYFCFDSWCRASLLWKCSFASLPCHNREWKLTGRWLGTTLWCARAWPHYNRSRPCCMWVAGLNGSIRTKKPAEPVVTGWPCRTTSGCGSFRSNKFFLEALRHERYWRG